jgi:hypothetical protein
MAEGRSNAGIAAELVVSGGAVEKHVASIFTKLGLPPDDNDNRRVLAVLRYLGAPALRVAGKHRAGRVCHEPRRAQCQELKEPMVPRFPLRCWSGARPPRAGRRRRAGRMAADCGRASAAACPAEPRPFMSVYA